MKRVLIIGALALAVVLGAKAMNKPGDNTDDLNSSNDDFEGKTIQNTGAKNWSVVLGGKRYGFMSGTAFSNYVAKNPQAGVQNEIGDAAYNAFPEGGFIDENGNVVKY